MPDELAIVDAVGGSTIRLNLNSKAGHGWYLSRQPGFDPPDYDRALVRTLMRDGSTIPAGAYTDRTIILPLRCDTTVAANREQVKATRLSALGAELGRDKPILRWRPTGGSGYTYYRLHPSPGPPVDRWDPADGILDATATILAEPFGLGAPVTAVTGATVNNDPAAGSNGCFVDATGIIGDVETPAKILMTANSNNMAPIISVRRHGIVTDITPFVQAESAAQGTDTTTGADAAMSNSSRSRCSFATVATMATRLTFDFPYSGGFARTAARGLYRLFVVVASSATTNTYAIRFRVTSAFGGAQQMAQGDTVTYTATDTSRQLVNLGLLQVPVGPDPFWDGYGGESLAGNVSLQVQAQRVSGSGSLDFDYLAGIPASEEFFEVATTYLDLVADGVTDTLYTPDGIGAVTGAAVPPIAKNGYIPMLTPGQTNRLYFLRPDGYGNGHIRGPDTKSRTATVTVTYWPRYLSWAP